MSNSHLVSTIHRLTSTINHTRHTMEALNAEAAMNIHNGEQPAPGLLQRLDTLDQDLRSLQTQREQAIIRQLSVEISPPRLPTRLPTNSQLSSVSGSLPIPNPPWIEQVQLQVADVKLDIQTPPNVLARRAQLEDVTQQIRQEQQALTQAKSQRQAMPLFGKSTEKKRLKAEIQDRTQRLMDLIHRQHTLELQLSLRPLLAVSPNGDAQVPAYDPVYGAAPHHRHTPAPSNDHEVLLNPSYDGGHDGSSVTNPLYSDLLAPK